MKPTPQEEKCYQCHGNGDVALGYGTVACPSCSPSPTETSWEERYDKLWSTPVSSQDANGGQDIKRFISELITQAERRGIERALEAVESLVKKRKPNHGACCTCQTCGGDIDNCDCASNEWIQGKAVEAIKALIPTDPAI